MKLAAFIVAFAAAIAFTALGNSYYVFIMATLGLTALVGIGLNVLLGLAGQVSFGHVGFYAIGAYTAAVLTVALKWNFWLALPVAALLAGATGALLALPAMRVRGPYLAMVTIAFGFVIENIAVEWRGVTGGQNGIMGTVFGLKAFAVAILGGITSAWGVVLAGLIFGLVESSITAFLGSAYTQILTFTLVIVALALRPHGLFGAAALKKV